MSRKSKRKSSVPPGRQEIDLDAGEKSTGLLFVLGIFLVFLTLCVAQATMREIYIGMHRDDYVRDEMVVSSMTPPLEETWLGGQMASSGESVYVPICVAGPDGLDRFRELQREGRIKGQRVPVWYLPQQTPWWVTGPNPVRLIHVSQFEDCFGGWRTAVAITVPLAIVTVFLLVYGFKQIRGHRGEPAT